MADANSDAPSDPLASVPKTVDGGDLVGVNATGVPIYFDEEDDRAFEALQSGGEWAVGEERTNAELDDIVAEIARLTGWAELSDYGEQAQEA
jgi:hypothetical protein